MANKRLSKSLQSISCISTRKRISGWTLRYSWIRSKMRRSWSTMDSRSSQIFSQWARKRKEMTASITIYHGIIKALMPLQTPISSQETVLLRLLDKHIACLIGLVTLVAWTTLSFWSFSCCSSRTRDSYRLVCFLPIFSVKRYHTRVLHSRA